MAKLPLAAALKERPALVLLEVGLPDVNGYEVCQELREQIDEQLPVVFLLGGRTQPIDRAAAFLVGGDDYVVKPFESDELLARVRRLLVRATASPRTCWSYARPHEAGLRGIRALRKACDRRRSRPIW